MKITIFFLLLLIGCRFPHTHHPGDKHKKLFNVNHVKVAVKDILDRDGYVSWSYSPGRVFLVKKIWNSEKEQSCKSCHEHYSLEEMRGEVHARAHWPIRLEHAPGQVMNCQTCHNGDQVWMFHSGEETVDANHAPRACLQCHFQQEEDWELGSHGKRAVGWQYERAVYNCLHCHDPHRPSFERTWPKVAPERPIDHEVRL